MPLYNHIITIFNFDYPNNIFLPTLINNVECQYHIGIDRMPEYNLSRDRCLCFIKYSKISNKKVSDEKIYLPKDKWVKEEDKTKYFTLQTDKDFFAIGDYSSVHVDSYENFKNEHTESSFLINEFRDFESIIPHWEIYGG